MAMFDQLSNLDTSKTAWKVKVRVTRMWPSVSNSEEGKENLKGFNLILLDDDNFHVQAFVYADNWKTLADKIDEGGLYVITNFYTKEALGSLKPVSSKFLINFSHSTSVDKVLEDDLMIPRHKFEFVDLGELFNVASSYVNVDYPEYSTDVIGVLEDFEEVKSITTKYGQRNIVKFRITDGRHSHKVSIWGELAIKTDAAYKGIDQRPIIVIVTSTKLKTFRNSVQISTLPSSKVYLNLENDSVTAMRQRLTEEGYTVSEQVQATPVDTCTTPVIEKLSLKQLSEITDAGCIKKQIFCNVKIQSIDDTVIWWYNSCSGCQADVEKIEGKFKCTNCPKTVPVAEKRYRIVILGEDSTEAFNFILADRAARRLLGMTATKLISDMLKLNMAFPPIIKDLCGKEVKLKILISTDNITGSSRLYMATDAFHCSDSTSVMPEPTMTSYTTSSIGDNNVVDLSDAGNTPISTKSATKKIKVEV